MDYGQENVNLANASQHDIYTRIRKSTYNFRVLTLDGADSDEDGMMPRTPINSSQSGFVSGWKHDSGNSTVIHPNNKVYQGFKFGDMPASYVVGDSAVYNQSSPEIDVTFSEIFDFDIEYPEAEYHLNDSTRKWVRLMNRTILNRQTFPIYTSMETMTVSHHDLTE